MTEAALDRLLAVLLGAILVTGVLTWRAGSPETWWLYALHGLLAGILFAASALKLRRSVPRALASRRWRQLAVGALLAAATIISLGAGFLWVAGGRYAAIGFWTLLEWHGMVGWGVLALALVHLAMRGRWRLLRPSFRRSRPARASVDRSRGGTDVPVGRLLSRRSVLAAGSLAAVGALVWGAAGILDRLGATPRRFTGSRWLPPGGIPAPTTFLGEGTPYVERATWRLHVEGAVARPLELSLDELEQLGTDDQAHVLDCTGGWAMETTWRGVPMAAVLAAAAVRPGARAVEVRSVTGWGTRLTLDEARRALLATGVAGVELPAGNGAPCRLVVPDRRGLDWVKWVASVSVA